MTRRRPSTLPPSLLPPRVRHPKPPRRHERSTTPPHRTVPRIVDEEEASLLDLVDNLLNNGVVLNADLVLALADVDLVYIRLSALLCASDRLVPAERRR